MRGIPPTVIDMVVAEVSFQTERPGWQTDRFSSSATEPPLRSATSPVLRQDLIAGPAA